jgi:hypothetical protein
VLVACLVIIKPSYEHFTDDPDLIKRIEQLEEAKRNVNGHPMFDFARNDIQKSIDILKKQRDDARAKAAEEAAKAAKEAEAASNPFQGLMPSNPCKVSELSKGIWAHKGVTGPPERFEPTTKESVDSAKDCAAKCCQNKECNAFVFMKTERVCWLYNADPKKLESQTQIYGADDMSKGSVDRSGGMNDLTKSLSGGATQTMESIYGVLGSGLSTVAVVGIVLAVLAIGIPIAVYAYKYLGGGALSSSSLPIVNPVTRIKIPVAK